MLIARGLLEGLIQPSQEIADIVAECLMCGYCEARCALGNTEILAALRADLARAGFFPRVHREKADRIVQKGLLFDVATPIRREGTTPLYLGCTYQTKPAEVKTILSVLEKCGFDPLIGEETCCSYIVEATGFPDIFEMAQARFREVYRPYLDSEILTVCPTCTITLREKYGLNVKPAIVAVAERLGAMGQEKAAAYAGLGAIPEIRRNKKQVTYHDPCHLGRMLGVFEEPRALIAMLGMDLVEMEHNRYFSTCCGGGGGLMDVDRQMAVEIAKDRVRDAVLVGVDTIVTCCPTCEPTLLRGAGRLANEVDIFVDVQGLWQLLDQALD